MPQRTAGRYEPPVATSRRSQPRLLATLQICGTACFPNSINQNCRWIHVGDGDDKMLPAPVACVWQFRERYRGSAM